MRYQCMGPGFDQAGSITSPAILLEAGGGSGGVDLIGLQIQLSQNGTSKNYSVCAYDRAGYGVSW